MAGEADTDPWGGNGSEDREFLEHVCSLIILITFVWLPEPPDVRDQEV